MFRCAALLVLLSSLGCTTTKFVIRDSRQASPPGGSGQLRALEERVQGTVGKQRSGFKLLEQNALVGNGEVAWVSGKEVRREVPVREAGQRREELWHLLLPADLY